MRAAIQACAGGIVFDPAGRILLIRRGTPPAQGTWSVPGGRCRPGEPTAAACVREVAEETGVQVQVLRLAGTVDREAPGGGIYRIDDFVCTLAQPAPEPAREPQPHSTPGSGQAATNRGPRTLPVLPEPIAADDAADARWVDAHELQRLVLAPGLLDCLRRWGLLPR